MSVGWERATRGASERAVTKFERALGAELPAAYRRFLLESDGGEPESNQFAVGGSNNSGVNEFFSLGELQDEDRSRMPEGCLPIADAEGGNLVLLDLGDGSVLFWDHEIEGADGVTRLAADFAEFRELLEPFDVSAVELEPGQVKRVWSNPNALTDLP